MSMHGRCVTCSEWLAAKSAAADEIARQAELQALEEKQLLSGYTIQYRLSFLPSLFARSE